MAAIAFAGSRMSDKACTKVAQAVIRLLAFGCVATSFILYSGDLLLYLAHKEPSGAGWLVLKSVPFLVGMLLYWKSRDWAARLTKEMD